jgi:Spy/CpxP family protein refolding chaperone
VNHRVIAFRKILLTAGIALFTPLSVQAQPIPGDLSGQYLSQLLAWHCEFGCGAPVNGSAETPWFGSGVARTDDAMPPVPMLRGLTLTESQRDKVFTIFHAQAPTLRENIKALRRAHEDLEQLALSAHFDQAKAKSLVDSCARSIGTLALLRAEGEHEIYALLTEEQRQQLQVIQRPFRRE